VQLVESLRLEMPPGGRVLLDGEDVTALIRTREVTAATGPVADSPAVRRRLARMQRTIAAGRDMVCEGRDQGTIVFPDAACKFFLVADPVERARRRQCEMAARGEAVEFEQVLREQDIRDQRDAARDLAPMKPAEDAVLLDSTRLNPEQVVEAMAAEVRRRASGGA
jgi:cytidylate kinase